MVCNNKNGVPNRIKGFMLTELMVICALNLIVISSVIMFLEFIQTSYARTQVQMEIQQKFNIALLSIEKDVRAASKPNTDTKSINIINTGQGISIYAYDFTDQKYKNTIYRLNPDNKSLLQKGWVKYSFVGKPLGLNPDYGVIIDDPSDYKSGNDGKWKTIIDSVKFQDISNNQLVIFSDISQNTTSDRRTINISIALNDAKGRLENPLVFNSIYTSRSKE